MCQKLEEKLRIGMDNHNHFMGLALEEALKAYERSEVPVGAVLVSSEGEILASAHNSPISLCDPTAHAEILALRQAALRMENYRLPGVTAYVTLEPCSMCVGAMLQARIGTLVIGALDPRSGAAGSVVDLTRVPIFNHNIQVVSGILSDDCADLLRRFFRERR
jgi:tRNA(adenine34) deaminase